MFLQNQSGGLSWMQFSDVTILYIISTLRPGFLCCRATSFVVKRPFLGAGPPSPALPHPYSENSCDSFFRPVDLQRCPEVNLGIPKPTSGHRQTTPRWSAPDSRDVTATRSSKKIMQPLDPTNQHKTTRKHKQNSTSGPLKWSTKTTTWSSNEPWGSVEEFSVSSPDALPST